MGAVDWNTRADQGTGLQSVIDPGDRNGLKNSLIDRIQWNCIAPWAARRHSVLDFGCGIGRFSRRFDQLGVRYCGVDASATMIDMARRQHAGLPAQFLHVSDGSPLPFDDASFDGGLSVWVLQYLKTTDHAQLYAVVAELARVLSTGGELLLIEQASASGQASGSVSESSTEQDYLDVLGAWFDIESVLRIRCGRLSRLSALYSRYGNWLPFRHQIEDLLAWYETARAQHADAAFLQGMSYYDVAIRAVRRSST